MRYETIDLRTKNLVIKKGDLNSFLRVYEYDFNKLKNIDGIYKLEINNNDEIRKSFKNGKEAYYSKIKKAKMFDWILYFDDVPIGNIYTNDEEQPEKSIYVSFNLHPKYWGKGYIPEALIQIIEYLFSIGYDNIISGYLDGNNRAKRVIEKLGFKPYKIIKDSYTSDLGNKIDEYKSIITKDDWFSRTSKISI